MSSLIQEDETARNLYEKGDFVALFDYAHNHFRNLSYSQPKETKPFTQNQLIQRQPVLPTANPESEVHQETTISNSTFSTIIHTKPSQENPLIINPDNNNDMETWKFYAQILNPELQSMPSLGNNSEPLQSNPLAEPHQQPTIPVPFSQNSWIQREGKRHKSSPIPELHHDASVSRTKNKRKTTDSLVVQGTDLEDHVKNSWAFVSQLGDDFQSDIPAEESLVWEVSETSKARIGKPNMELIINGIEIDTPKIPTPVCSCTGIPRKCYRYGKCGWQSACCTTTISRYPLNNIRRGIRTGGRIMSRATFKLVLEQVLSEGHNFFVPIDLKTHWVKSRSHKHKSMSELLAET